MNMLYDSNISINGSDLLKKKQLHGIYQKEKVTFFKMVQGKKKKSETLKQL